MHWITSILCFSVLANAVEDNSLLWGPYRPNIYFGWRPRLPESFISGLLWYEANSLTGVARLRHDCTNDDKVDKFGWTAWDPRTGGRQVIADREHGANITTEVVKSSDGLSWEIRVKGDQSPNSVLTTVWYSSLESAEQNPGSSGDYLKLAPRTKRKLTPKGIEGDVEFHGFAKDLGGKFVMTVSAVKGEIPTHSHEINDQKPAENAHYTSLYIPKGQAWRSRDVFLTFMQDQVGKFIEKYGENEILVPAWSVYSLTDDDKLGGNSHFVQKTFQGPFEYTISFKSASSSEDDSAASSFDERLDAVLKAQAAKFDKSLSIQEPYSSDEAYHAFANEMISSIAGGIGYFYGDSLIKDVETGNTEHTKPRGLFTGTPSRTFFPRGFYWDEGFNALALMSYDTDLVLQIINSWFQTMDEDGYIEREQILGDEGRSRVPPEFQVQDPTVANPPTLVMALAHLGAINNDKALLRKFYPALKTHFEWFRREQRGETVELDRDYPSPEVYRWRGRTPTHILASGLDDYPRAPEVNDGELNVDLISWIGAMATSLSRVATILDEPKDAARFQHIIEGVQKNLKAVHWSDEHSAFCDVGVDDFEEDTFACHRGYVTLLPFFLKLVPGDWEKQLLAVLDDLYDPDQLWSVAGIRSLSKSDEFFATGENYWRGPVWNNMNFLALDALSYYASPESGSSEKVQARAAEIYHELRRNVVDNIYKQWKKTGYVWESYDALTGDAKGAKAFTGWAGLVANIMAMPDTVGSVQEHGHHDEPGHDEPGHDERSHDEL